MSTKGEKSRPICRVQGYSIRRNGAIDGSTSLLVIQYIFRTFMLCDMKTTHERITLAIITNT
jgi:hypothetical protein